MNEEESASQKKKREKAEFKALMSSGAYFINPKGISVIECTVSAKYE